MASTESKASILTFCSPDMLAHGFMTSVLQLLAVDADGKKYFRNRVLGVRSGPVLDKARNLMTSMFMHAKVGKDRDPEYLFFIDSDMQFEPKDVYTVLEAADRYKRPVVGGLCFRFDLEIAPVMYLDDGQGHGVNIKEYPDNELVRIDFTGAAFLAVHRSVFAAMSAKYGEGVWWNTMPSRGTMSEDWAFFTRLKEMGVPAYIHTGAKIGHLKLVPIAERHYKGGALESAFESSHGSKNALARELVMGPSNRGLARPGGLPMVKQAQGAGARTLGWEGA